MEENPKTPRGRAYQDTFLDKLDGKISVPRSAEGVPNWQVFKVARAVDEELQSFPQYIGVVPHGSQMRGLSVDSSDLDIAVFEDRYLDNQKPNMYARACEAAEKTASNARIGLYTLDSSTISNVLHSRDGIGQVGVAFFCGPVIGPKVAEYRDRIGKIIRELSADEQRKVVGNLAGNATVYDFWGAEKASPRIPELQARIPEDLGLLYFEKRQPMWEKRIKSIFNLTI